MCAVPVVDLHARSIGEATANSGAATMMRIRCWTMWTQKSSPSYTPTKVKMETAVVKRAPIHAAVLPADHR